MAGVVALLVWQFGVPWVRDWAGPSSSGGAETQAANSAVGCPDVVAGFLPGGAATLIARYQSDKHLITICEASTGQLYYDGQVKGKPSDSVNHISLPASATGQGFIAHNGVYTYEIRGMEIIVSKSGSIILNSSLVAA